MHDNCIHIENLSKCYDGSEIYSLNKISFSILKGEKFGLLGPNGAGKTTLISILCGIFSQSAGDVFYLNNNSNVHFNDIKGNIGYVPQEYAFYQELTPVQNLEYFGALYNLSSTLIKERTKSVLKVLGLSDVANKRIDTFSGGMKRRVNLAIGVIHEPKFLFLDEPTVGVDVQSKVAILKFLNELNLKGTTIIYTSHHLGEAQEFCNRIALIDFGEIIVKGEINHLLQSNQSKDLKDLFIKLTGEEYRD